MLRQIGIGIVATTAALALTACTGGGTVSTASPTQASSLNSCTVLSVGEVGSGLGQTVAPGVRGKSTVEGGIACVYYGPSVAAGANPDTPIPDSVRIVLVKGPSAQKWFHDYLTNVAPITLKNLGDDAFYDGTASVNVLKGDRYVRISVIKATGSDEKAEIALAKIALPRL